MRSFAAAIAALCLHALCLQGLVLFAPERAHAQGFRLDRYLAPPTTEDGVSLQLPSTLGDLRWSAGLMLDYAHGPLVLDDGAGEELPLVEHLFAGHLVFGLGLADFLELHLRLPIVFAQGGESPEGRAPLVSAPDTAALSDGAIGASVRLFELSGFSVGLAAELMIPLWGDSSLSSDTEIAVRGRAMAAYSVPGAITIALDLGVAYRPERTFLNARTGTELTYGLGVYVPVLDEPITILGELWGATTLVGEQAFTDEGTPLEALVGARYSIEGVAITGGIGFGFTRAVGTPDVRALLGVGYAPPVPVERAPSAPRDRDGDGILDDDDRCPAEPEDADEFEDADGCPDPDNDQDGVLDPNDACALDPEDPDHFEDENGCPDPDNDADRLLDPNDNCPNEAEDVDQFQDDDGCPDADNDGDGFTDPIDACPNEAEIVNEHEDDDGCPDEEPALTALRELGMRILFPHDRDRPTGPSVRVLRQVSQMIRQHPEWLQIEIEAHTDSSGDATYNMELSRRRGENVRAALIRAGVPEERLTTVAHGEEELDMEETDENARAQNRRVEFTILSRQSRSAFDREAP